MSATASVPGPRAPSGSSDVIPVYVWELPVRLTHWLIVLSIFTLAFTGFYMGRPFLVVSGPAGERFVMGTMRAIHFYAAIVFTLSVLVRVGWMFTGNTWARWNQLVPTSRTRLTKLVQMFLFYSFLRARPVRAAGHNPLAGAAYVLVFGLYFLEIATGLAIYSATAAVDSPLRFFAFLAPLFGGLQTARWIHHVGMWLLLGFMAHHVFSAVLFSIVNKTGTMESIFSGYKFLRRDDLEEELRGARKR